MRHLGDITKINGYEVPIVDCVIGGSPCQDLSTAGKREGLNGARSGLFMEQIRIIREMRENDRKSGTDGAIHPRYMVWENVPGALSSNRGEDFRVVLEETARVADQNAVIPRPEKWRTSGCIMGDGWSIAWRILDAQFWGVPQRRRRIALVADFGGESAPEILFVRNGVCGDFEKSGGKGETTTHAAERCVAGINGEIATYAVKSYTDIAEDDIGAGQRASGGSYGGGSENLVVENHGMDAHYTLNTIDRPTVCAGFGAGIGAKAYGIGYMEEQAPTLSSQRHDASVVYPIVGEGVCGHIEESGGKGETTAHAAERCVAGINGEIATYAVKSYTDIAEDDIGAGQRASGGSYGGGSENFVFENHGLDARYTGPLKTAPTLAKYLGAGGNNAPLCVNTSGKYSVRRLTPLECERLQGYPDGWTDIGDYIDSKGKKRKTSDSARYKALGNSIALPPWKWVLKRLCACYERDATMASLFDGIGGFPLIWEQINGKGSCLWASEIEEFPMAVTNRRFGG